MSDSSNEDFNSQLDEPVLKPARLKSRFGRPPQERTIPYDHVSFVRSADSAIRIKKRSAILSSVVLSELCNDKPLRDPQVLKIGFQVTRFTGLQENLNSLKAEGYEFVVVDVARDIKPERVPICDLLLSATDWISHVAAYIHTDELRKNGTKFPFIDLQFTQAAHLSIRDVIIRCPENIEACTKLSRIISSKMQSSFSSTRMNIHLTIQSRRAQANLYLTNPREPDENGPLDPWKYWNHIRSQVPYDRRLGVALELDGDLPDPEEAARWCGEPINMIIIPFILFLPSPMAKVSIPSAYIDFITSIAKSNTRHISFLVKGHIPPAIHNKVIQCISEFGNRWVSSNLVDEFASGYEDYLQIPLQPLADNLESSTYEIFEKDPIKYEAYKKALIKAFERFPKEQTIVVLLVGAGRGPLIRCALAAARETGRTINLYAIEKNECAAYTLKSQIWDKQVNGSEKPLNNKVTIVNTDIRDWKAPELADILLSELLGSFSDNELSPECLDGAWKCLKPTAISIPESYRSYVVPILAHRLYVDALHESVTKGSTYTDVHFVTFMKNFYPISKPQRLIEFVHKDDLTKSPDERDNSRYERLLFKPKIECTLQGFAGYFDTTLIEDIKLSIVPETHTPTLISWFPTWIPLATPVHVKPTDEIILHFWRYVSKRNVWYEWCLQSPVPTRIQNTNGKFYTLGLS